MQAITNRHTFWMHRSERGRGQCLHPASSGARTEAAELKIVRFHPRRTGMEGLQKQLPSHVSKIYYRSIQRGWVNRALSTIHPEAVVWWRRKSGRTFCGERWNQRIPVFSWNAPAVGPLLRGYNDSDGFSGDLRVIHRCRRENEGTRRAEGPGLPAGSHHIVGSLSSTAAKLEERRLLDVPAMFRSLA